MHFWYYHSFVCNQLSVYGGGLCFSFSRYLESCATSALKRKSESLSIATSSSSSMSEEDKPAAAAHEDTVNADSKTPRSPFQAFLYPPKTLHRFWRLSPAEAALEGAGALDSQVSAGSATIAAPLTDITISTEAMSVVSVTSQCSYSSTIVHVPQPESGECTHTVTQNVFGQLNQT